MKIISIFFIAVLSGSACQETTSNTERMPTQQEVNRSMEDINREFAREEEAQIDGFVERRGWEMIRTGTGLRYFIYEAGAGDLAKDGMLATVEYTVSLIDGTEVYSSKDAGNRTFLIGQDNVESGIHEMVTYMRVGDKAMVVLPSHLAHGLTGDNDKIPPRSTVVYDLNLVDLR